MVLTLEGEQPRQFIEGLPSSDGAFLDVWIGAQWRGLIT